MLLLQFARVPEQWAKWGMDAMTAEAKLLETCMGAGDSKKAARVQHSGLVVTRRALRALLGSKETGTEVLNKLIDTFTAKGASSTAGNAVILGVIAGVSSRLADVKPALLKRKQDYYAFYVREIIGSRTALPNYVSDGLHDFFEAVPTVEELQKEVVPPIEKALLRAPEVVLGLIAPMILALPESIDLSTILLGNLLKPLLSNVKSTNPTIRAGALRTFKALAARSHDDAQIGKVADEILNPLKQGKVPSAEGKILHAQMLTSLSGSFSLAQKIPATLALVALKEPNEQAAVAEVTALTQHLTFGLANGVPLEKTVSDAFIKGMADKRIPLRRLWAIRAAELWWHLSPEQSSQPDIQAFCHTTLPKLVEMWQDVVANPIPATTSGMVTVGHYVTALLLTKVRSTEDDKLSAIYKKTNVLSQSLTVEPKPSFLLNPRVYTKLTSEEDIHIAVRALVSVATSLSESSTQDAARDAWAQAMIYFIVSQTSPPKGKSAAREALTQAYLKAPAEISKIMIQGLWTWYKAVEQGDKESAAIAAKSGTSELSQVLLSFCLPAEQLKTAEVPAETLRKQAVELLVLARSDIVPRASWIDLCLRMGTDPGQVARESLDECIALAKNATEVCQQVPIK